MLPRWLMYTLCLMFLFCLSSPIASAEAKDREKTVNEQILDILIKKKIITKQRYQELKEQQVKKEKEPQPEVGFDKGFYLKSTHGQHQIKLKGRFHGDYKGHLGDHPENNSFFVRRARIALSGFFYQYFHFKIESEFGKGKSRLNDGYMNIDYFPQAQLQFGQFKTPFSMEELHSDNWIDFIERSLINDLAPSRDLGAMLHGGLLNNKLYYQLGVFNGYKMNEASDADSGKDLALRLVIAPFKDSENWAFRGLRLGGAMTYGKQDLDTDQWWNSGEWKTAAGTEYLAVKDSVEHDGDRIRSGLELYWDWGSTALKSEYINTSLNDLQLGATEDDFNIRGGYVSLVHNLTGEKFVYKNGKPGRLIPKHNFDPHTSHWGAFQMGLRYARLEADADLLDQGFVDSTRYTDKASSWTFGINWYFNPMVRFMLNYNHVDFQDLILVNGDELDDEDVILSRFEIAL